MSDYARRLKAADLAFPKMVRASEPGGEDLELYEAYSMHTGDIQLQRGAEDPLAQLVVEAMGTLGKDKEGKLRNFNDTPTELYALLTRVANGKPMSANYTLSRKWPTDPTKLGGELTKLHDPLLRLGFDFTRKRSGKARNYQITRVPIPASGAGSDAQDPPE